MTSSNPSSRGESDTVLEPAFLALLCCPVCEDRPPLHRVRERSDQLVCDKCGRVYPIVDGLPDLRPQDGISDTLAPAAQPGGGGG